jgi:membrane protein implicated in regulation of membrane protease activity
MPGPKIIGLFLIGLEIFAGLLYRIKLFVETLDLDDPALCHWFQFGTFIPINLMLCGLVAWFMETYERRQGHTKIAEQLNFAKGILLITGICINFSWVTVFNIPLYF